MKLNQIVLSASLTLLLASVSFAQNPQGGVANDPPTAAEESATLRLQLVEVQEKEGELQNRVLLLDENLKPENIERALAGVGSTRPEELREQRRRQLENEKKSTLEQLEQLAASRARLEAAIANADALAYQQSARGFPLDQAELKSIRSTRGLLIAGGVALVGISVLLLLARKVLSNRVE